MWAVTISANVNKLPVSAVNGLAALTSLTSCYFLFQSRFYFRFYLSFRPCRARDLVTMAEVDSGRAVSLGRVTTGIGSVYRGAETKLNSLGTSSRPSWLGISVSITLLSNTRDFTLEIPKYSGVDLCLRRIGLQFLPQCNAKCILLAGYWCRLEKRSKVNSSAFFNKTNSSAIDGNSSSAQSEGARCRELSTPKGRFREGYRKIPHESRPTSKMSNATMYKHSVDERVFALKFNFSSYVESDVLKRFSRQMRT